MTIKIYGNHFERCGTGISAPADANLDIGANRFVVCGKPIDIREPATLLGALGLSTDTPLDVLREVLAYVSSDRRTEMEISEKVKSSGISTWLSAGADVATVVSGLASLVPYIPKILGANSG